MESNTKGLSNFVTHCSKLFYVLGTFLADCIGFTVNKERGLFHNVMTYNADFHHSGINERRCVSPLLLKLRSAVCALHYWMCDATLLW